MAKRNKDTPEKKKRQSARVPKMESLGKYQIEKEIGAGGMGAVFLAKDTTLNRLAALKILPRDKAENPVLVKRFKAEGQAAAHLRHENIVSVYDAGEEDGYLYIALEYVEGTDLHNLIGKRNRIPVRRSLEIITQVTEALAHAYQQGIVHRDIKPANILIRQDGVVKLTDLGLARSIDDNTETSITRAGTTVGTVDYMAPEQARDSKAADIRSDIYSLGCTWYHMLTGRAPFSEGSLTNKLAAHATTPPPDPRELNERVPEGIVAIIHRMMAKSKNDRYQTPEELLEDLKNPNLKRSNVDNNVLEALASDESDSEQPTREVDVLPPAESSDFQINQFIPDYSSPAEEDEDHSAEDGGNRLSTSFDLQQLAGEVELESDVTVPGLQRPAKSTPDKKSARSKSGPQKTVDRTRTRRPAQEPEEEEGSVISDSAMKTRQAGRSRKSEPESSQVKRSKPASSSPSSKGKKQTKPEPARRTAKRKSVRETSPVMESESSASESQISLDYRQIGLVLGGLLLLILLIWWGISSMGSGGGQPQGPGSNPFDPNAESQPVGGNEPVAAADPKGSDSEPEMETAETKAEVTEAPEKQVKPKASSKWGDVSVRGQEQQYLPAWGNGFSTLTGPKASGLESRLPLLKVARGAASEGIWGSLDEALEEVSSRGAVIRLYGEGPFQLSPQRLNGIPQLIIMAADSGQKKPTVILIAESGSEPEAITDYFTFSKGLLRLQGIHFLCDASRLSGSGECNLLALQQSDLTFQECSFSLTGNSQRHLRLINSTGPPRTDTERPEGESRILLENSVITGQQMEVLHVDQPYSDVMISNCYLSVTGAPCLELAGLNPNLDTSSLLQVREVPRALRVFSSTLVSDQSIFKLTGPLQKQDNSAAEKTEGIKTQTDLIVINSVLVGDPKAKQAAMLTLVDWPQDKLRQQSKSRFEDLNLQLESAMFWGWPLYLKSTEPGNPQSVFEVDAHRTWQQSWGKPVAVEAFDADLPSKYAALRTPAFDRKLLDFSKVKSVHQVSTGGIVPGCDPQRLSTLSAGQQERIQAYVNQPRIGPSIASQFKQAKTVSFDMSKGNLNDFLNSSAVSGPTRVNVTGQGVCYTAPLELENKQVRLNFASPSDGTPLIVELKLLPSAVKSRNRGTGVNSFIALKNSTLAIEGGKFRIAADRKGVVPRHFVSLQNSQLALEDSALDAMLLNDKRFQSVVQVKAGAAGKPNQVLLERTYLSASGTVVDSEATQLDLDVNQSLLLSLNDLFSLSVKPSTRANVRVSLNQSTLAPRESVFAFRQAGGKGQTGDSAARIFAEECLFLPSPAVSGNRSEFSTTASLLRLPENLQSQKLVEWWGSANGYMVERLKALGDSGSLSGGEFEQTLSRLFGNLAEQHSLTIPGGILLQDQKLPPLVKIQPTHFKLLPACKAATWTDLKQPLGADPVALQAMIEGKPEDREKAARKRRSF
ncbi:serine/threonine protein kinase [Gimesia panareensis]|uniref:non-specific serine/threonine protein kinase n=1 Tax=Gimesia panareensis TaxID=2527978 RepID=A0A517Q5M4_9PLAN|nr:serine/threonine-protein kinase [Gimesia panareensis]QDT26940.1 Serine/threonine-protein kinase PrkC [Gimesia panareensis]QDU50212.1 Serine/threonine-protein kinase PrkC [Gimesia panareensis]